MRASIGSGRPTGQDRPGVRHSRLQIGDKTLVKVQTKPIEQRYGSIKQLIELGVSKG